MARVGKFGKDSPERFIDGALDGGGAGPGGSPRGFQDSMSSSEMEHVSADRRGQTILRAYAMDNVGRVYDRYETSVKDHSGIHGGIENIEHSLKGATAVTEEVGAAGPVRHIIIPHH